MSELDDFMGCWEEVSKDGFDDMATALELPAEKKEFYKSAKTCITYAKDGDKWKINVGLLGIPGGRQFEFHLGQQYDSQDIDGSPMTSLVNAEGKKFVETHKNPNINADMDVERWIEGDKMLVKTSCKGFGMMSTYVKK